MRDFAHQIVYSAIFWGFRKSRTAKMPQRILTQNTPKDAVSGKDVPFRLTRPKFNILAEKLFNIGGAKSKWPLNVIVMP